MGLVVGGNGDAQVKAVGIPGLRQKGFGLFDILGIIVGEGVVKILGKGGVHAGPQCGAGAVGGKINDLLLVHGVAQRPPHPHVVQRLHRVVQIQRLHQIHRAVENLKAVSQLRGLRGGEMGTQVDGPALKGQHHRVSALKNLKGHGFQLRLFSPVVVKPLQNNGVPIRAGDEFEGAGADGSRRLPVVVCGKDGGGEGRQKFAVRRAEGNDHRFPVRCLHRLNIRKRLHQRGFTLTGVGAAFDGPDHIVRCHRRAVVELHALTQSEGVNRSVGRYLVVVGDRVDQISVRSGLYQPLKYVEHDFSGPCRYRKVWVKAFV